MLGHLAAPEGVEGEPLGGGARSVGVRAGAERAKREPEVSRARDRENECPGALGGDRPAEGEVH